MTIENWSFPYGRTSPKVAHVVYLGFLRCRLGVEMKKKGVGSSVFGVDGRRTDDEPEGEQTQKEVTWADIVKRTN